MSAGLTVTKADVDSVAGSIARDVYNAALRTDRFKTWLDAKTDAQLIALGYVQADVDDLRSAFADAKQLADLFNGLATLSVAKDFKAFLKRIWGLGGLA